MNSSYDDGLIQLDRAAITLRRYHFPSGTSKVIALDTIRGYKAEALGLHQGTTSIVISCLWPLAMLVVAWVIYQRISSDQPREIVAPFALTFAWVLVAPWVFAWYTALAWATLTLVPRNRMTRWLTIVTVFLALWLSGGGQSAPGH